jgi:hypothetical protein
MQRLTITGTIDGYNAVFAVSPAPTFVKVYRNTLLQAPNQDYSLGTAGASSLPVEFMPTSIPQPGDALVAVGEV